MKSFLSHSKGQSQHQWFLMGSLGLDLAPGLELGQSFCLVLCLVLSLGLGLILVLVLDKSSSLVCLWLV